MSNVSCILYLLPCLYFSQHLARCLPHRPHTEGSVLSAVSGIHWGLGTCPHQKRGDYCTMEYYSAKINKETLSFVTTWTDLEGTMLNKKSDKNKYHDLTYTWNLKQTTSPHIIDTGNSHLCRLPQVGGGPLGDRKSKRCTSSYKINTPWGCKYSITAIYLIIMLHCILKAAERGSQTFSSQERKISVAMYSDGC